MKVSFQYGDFECLCCVFQLFTIVLCFFLFSNHFVMRGNQVKNQKTARLKVDKRYFLFSIFIFINSFSPNDTSQLYFEVGGRGGWRVRFSGFLAASWPLSCVGCKLIVACSRVTYQRQLPLYDQEVVVYVYHREGT